MPAFNTRDRVRLKGNPERTGYVRNPGAEGRPYGVRMDDLDETEWHGADALELIPIGEPAFSVGEVVRLRTNLAQQGAVLASQYLHNGFQYDVFFDPTNRGWYPETSLLPIDNTPRAIDGNKFLRDLALVKLRSNLSDTLYSYRATRTNVEPYQFKPAMKFFESPNHRLFIADEVGLGKTIEAGIIYLELKARNDDLNRVLVVCPSGLRYKWKDEMFNRFSEEFEVIENAAAFNRKLENYGRYGDAEKFKAIVSMETIRQRGNAVLIDEVGLTLDLVIIDEAHHMRNSNTLTHRIGRTLSAVSDAMLMLSATPIQLRSEDMFNQFRILDEGEFEDFQVFEQLREPNIHINRASRMLSTAPSSYAPALEELQQVEQTTQRERYVKNPFYLNICDRLANPANAGHKELVDLRRDLQKINTFASVFNRTTKKDVSSGVMREANVIHVDLTEEEKSFYNAVMEHSLEQSGILASIQRERQAASCMSAAREYFADLVEDATADIHAEASDPDIVREEDEGDAEVQDSADGLQDASEQIGNTDSKFAMFIDAMNRLREESPDSKVLVFATFRRTIDYLRQSLRTPNSPYAGSVYMIHGGVPPQERLQVIDRFKASDGFGILLLSEVGSEGMDFQFCDTVFNYDLPWNPMRVEQRIGRVDRYGQKSEKVKVYSLVLNDTIENRILERLYDRINVFEESIGDLEVILGDEIYKLQKEIFQSKLTPEQQVARTEMMLNSIEFKRKQAEEFAKEQDRFMGQDIIFEQQFDQVRNGGRFISEAEVRALVEEFIRDACPNSRLTPNPRNTHLFSVRGGSDLQAKIAGNLSVQFPPAIKAPLSEKLRRPKGFPVTFDGETALGNPLFELLNLQNPIVVAARDHFEAESALDTKPTVRLGSAIIATDNAQSIGEYAFFIYWVRGSGAERLSSLVPIVIRLDTEQRAEHIETSLLASLQQAEYQDSIPGDYDWDDLEDISLQYFTGYQDRLQSESETRNNDLIDTRITSLRQTSAARMRSAHQQIAETTDERIRTMRRSQIANEGTRLQARINEEEAKRGVDIGGNLELAGYIRYILS